MDNHLTPNKIERLMRLAQDRSFQFARTLPLEEVRRLQQAHAMTKSTNCEASSGLLDLDQVEAIEECESEIGVESELLCTSAAFNAGEMTGRSTGTEDTRSMACRNSLAIETLTSQMNKQTNEIKDLMRHSICTDYSFHSKRDLTADEVSLMQREAPLPIQNTTQTYFADSVLSQSNLSVGSYFQKRCPEFGKMLAQTDSPDKSAYSAMPSITEVSSHFDTPAQMPPKYQMDGTLDSVPIKQPRPHLPTKQIEKSFHTASTHNETYNKDYLSISKTPEYTPNMNPVASSTIASNKVLQSYKPTDVLIRNLQASMKLVTDDTEGSVENSLSISKIADYLGKESNVSVTGILNLKSQTKSRKQPLSEIHENLRDFKPVQNLQDVKRAQIRDSKTSETQVINLADTREIETASSAGTICTVMGKLKIAEKEIPVIDITNTTQIIEEGGKVKKHSSPSSKSHSTLSTVQENYNSFKSGDSPLHTSNGDSKKGESPYIQYRELDKSVDWRDVMQMKQDSLPREKWADITVSPASGFVGGSCAVTMTVTTLTDNWLTAKLQFDDLPNNGKDITIETPRFPLLLSPGKSEQFTFHITSYIELHTALPYTMLLKDASIDSDVEQKGTLDINVEVPIIQAMSSDGANKLIFPPILEQSNLVKSFVLLSDCPVDLQLELSMERGDLFSIKSVQELKRSDVNKVLLDKNGAVDDGRGRTKSKGMYKQLCRLTTGNAILVTIRFNAPKLNDRIEQNVLKLTGALNVNLLGVNTVLRRVELVGQVGTTNLIINAPDKLQLTHESTKVSVTNSGSVGGVWVVRFGNPMDGHCFEATPAQLEIKPGTTKHLALCYTGPDDMVTNAILIFEELTTGQIKTIEITGGTDKPVTFPIRTNRNTVSWVRSERKELSLKNCTNNKVHILCHTVGEGFGIDLPGVESRGVYCLPFGPNECRSLPILFKPVSFGPHSATLHLACDKNKDFSRTVKLFGCGSGEGVRWSGLVTYGSTALVRAEPRAPALLHLTNRAAAPAFVCAHTHFNLQYTCVSQSAVLEGGKCVIPARGRHALSLRVDWARVERRARAVRTETMATITLLTGAEITRRRILRILRDKSTGVIDTSPLEPHLRVLAETLQGEDPYMDDTLADYAETKASLAELVGGLHELTAQIVLPQDFGDEHTILITDDTVTDHYTLCE